MKNGPNNLEEQMRRATEAAARGTGSRDDLESAARALVKELRSAQAPPEQMLVRIKEILADAGLRPAYATTDETVAPEHEAAIYRSVIEWSIRQYYDERERNVGENLPGH